MEQEHIEDSIDDLISLLNFQKTPSSNLPGVRNVAVEREALELERMLNASYEKTHSLQAALQTSSSHTQKHGNKSLTMVSKPNERTLTKTDLITRNFFTNTPSYGATKGNILDFEERGEQEEINFTFHPKVSMSSSAIRYLRFQPLLTDIKDRPKTPTDLGYYFKFNSSEVTLIKYLLESNGFRETSNSNLFSILWSNGPIKNETYQCLGYYQKANHFPKSQEITRKDAMHRNISKMQVTFGLKNFNFIPKSFILPNEIPVLESDFEKNKGMWYIVKPQASSQGRGIFITNKLEDIMARQNQQIIVSHYLNDPFLINGLKFDLRVYVALTSVNPLRIYIYQEGLVRFATVPYSKDSDSYHNSINKKSEAFVQNDDTEDEESCSKWSFTTFKNYLESLNLDHKAIFQKIEDLVVKTILSVESTLFNASVSQVPQRHNCFELFGFDILLDSKLKPWLLEVNLSPSLGCESALDLKIKSELISDLFNMTGIVPLDQRTYTEVNLFGKNQNLFSYGAAVPSFDKKTSSSGYSEVKPVESLTKEEKAIIRETNEEWERFYIFQSSVVNLFRRGKFKRIYPSANINEYKNFFEVDRPYNALLRNV